MQIKVRERELLKIASLTSVDLTHRVRSSNKSKIYINIASTELS